MLARTHRVMGAPRFVVDESSLIRGNGGQISWDDVDVAYEEADGKKFLKAGTVVGKTLGGGKWSPRVVTTNEAAGILETDAKEDSPVDAMTGYSILKGGNLYENLLPDSAGGPPKVLDAAIKTELAAAGCLFQFETYDDTR